MTGMRRGWFHLASGAGFGRICGFAGNLLISRWLGPSDLGLFNLITSTIQTSETLVRCGGDYALNYELGSNPDAIKTQHGLDLARAFTQICTLATFLVCSIVFLWVVLGRGLFPYEFGINLRIRLTLLLLLMIACEGLSASAWEVLLVSHRTRSFALRQGLFQPLRLLLAALGVFAFGIAGAMLGWAFAALAQCIWLKKALKHLWNPIAFYPSTLNKVLSLLKRGFPFYLSNLASSLVFFPLLVKVSLNDGLVDIGYLRVGQVIQQLFAFVPSTLVPILFLELRTKTDFDQKVKLLEKPLRIIWIVMLQSFLLYTLLDSKLIDIFFGAQYQSALTLTRLLVMCSLLESLSQLVVQPHLANGHTRLYGLLQNGAAVAAAFVGWLWIPYAGILAFIGVKLIYVAIPLLGFLIPLYNNFQLPRKLIPLFAITVFWIAIYGYLLQANIQMINMSPLILASMSIIVLTNRSDIKAMVEILKPRKL